VEYVLMIYVILTTIAVFVPLVISNLLVLHFPASLALLVFMVPAMALVVVVVPEQDTLDLYARH